MSRSRRTAEAYDAVADDYDLQFGDELHAKPRDRELLDALARRGTGLAVDVGCGPGHIGARVRASGRPVVGVDISVAMTRAATGRLNAAVVADMVRLPFATASVADLVAFYSLIHLPRSQLPATLVEFARILEPGGHALISAHEGTGDATADTFLGHAVHLTASYYSMHELVTAARSAGLDVHAAEDRDPYENEGTTRRLYVDLERP